MTDPVRVTDAVVEFIGRTSSNGIPADAVTSAKRCVIDGLGVMLAGSTQVATHILRVSLRVSDSRTEATAFGLEPFRTGAATAALLNGTSGHALDWDDTQLATSADRIFGLLTHPTVPALAAALAVGERQRVSGQRFLEAFLIGVEVECKIAEAIHPSHYAKGFHSSGTIGTFGAAAAAAKLRRLVIDNDVQPDQITTIRVRAGSNILNPLRYVIATNELEAKFCPAFMVGAIASDITELVQVLTDAARPAGATR